MSTDVTTEVRHLMVGEVIHEHEQMETLPLGTVIGPDTRNTWRKIEATLWESTREGSTSGPRSFSLGYNKVISLPESPAAAPQWTLRQWQWRWLDHALWSAESAGVGIGVVTDAALALGCGNGRFPIGAGVRMRSSYQRDRLPVNSVVYIGKPENYPGFGVLVKTTPYNDWRLVLGRNNSIYGQVITVVSVPDGSVADWVTEVGTAEDEQAVADFKARAWRIGWQVKLKHRWCSSYESYMEQVGLTPEALRGGKYGGIAVGDRIPPDQAMTLPHGSVLRWRAASDETRFAWFMRDDNSGHNQARTRRLFATDGVTRHYASTMEVLWIQHEADAPWSIPLDHNEQAMLPGGARVEMDGQAYRVALDGRVANDSTAVPSSGSWTFSQFQGQTIRLVSL